ncbi:MAG: hypothetical protein WCQ00_00100 [bacterium]
MKTKTKGNKYLGIILLIIILVVGAWYLLGNKKKEVHNFDNVNTSATSTSNLNFDPLNFSYDIEGEKITLANGTSTSDIVPGSAEKLETTVFDKPAIGDLNNDKENDSAVLLVQDSGGTGLFYYVVSVMNNAGVIKNTNSIFIGDRIEPISIKIRNGKIELVYIDRNTDEPMSAEPTVRTVKTFEVKGMILQ